MSEGTKIQWTNATFNPWIGCMKVSEGCKNCYAEVSTPTRVHREKGLELWGPPATTTRKRTSDANWKLPLRWDRAAAKAGTRTRVFCASLSDVFEDHPSLDAWRKDLFALIEATPNLDWQLLTKRPQNIRSMLPASWLESPRANVWFGATVESQEEADLRIPSLLKVPAAVRFLSMEPLLEDVDLRLDCIDCFEGEAGFLHKWNNPHPCDYACGGIDIEGPIHWVIVGGESGHNARPFNLAWARSIVAQCKDVEVSVFVKQLGLRAQGDWLPVRGQAGTYLLLDARDKDPAKHRFMLNDPHGGDMSEWPEDLRVREMPALRRPHQLGQGSLL